jgi:phosphatidylethanolamine/phosphatidyl-N-methylethanolamine N-methyltransferase
MPSDLALFLRQLVRRPQQVVALSPSSAELARAMTADLSAATGRVAELGAGTGKLTRAILDRGVAPADLTLFELNADFCDHLRATFPGVTVLGQAAETLGRTCAPGLGAVISGLPLLSMPNRVQMAILQGAFDLLRPGGKFVQFTYGPRPPVAEEVRQALGLIARRGEKVWGNLPPARVYSITLAAT